MHVSRSWILHTLSRTTVIGDGKLDRSPIGGPSVRPRPQNPVCPKKVTLFTNVHSSRERRGLKKIKMKALCESGVPNGEGSALHFTEWPWNQRFIYVHTICDSNFCSYFYIKYRGIKLILWYQTLCTTTIFADNKVFSNEESLSFRKVEKHCLPLHYIINWHRIHGIHFTM